MRLFNLENLGVEQQSHEQIILYERRLLVTLNLMFGSRVKVEYSLDDKFQRHMNRIEQLLWDYKSYS